MATHPVGQFYLPGLYYRKVINQANDRFRLLDGCACIKCDNDTLGQSAAIVLVVLGTPLTLAIDLLTGPYQLIAFWILRKSAPPS